MSSTAFLRRGTFRIVNLSFWCPTTRAVHAEASSGQSTVDENDIKHFSKLVDTWWDDQNASKALHSLNSLRVPLIRDGLIQTNNVSPSVINYSQPLQGCKILEVGCGGGILTEPLARLGAEVTGVDASQSMIEIADAHASGDPEIRPRLRYITGTIEEHVRDHQQYYDAVVASEVLEHVVHKDVFVDACSSSLKTGGSFFLTTLNKSLATWGVAIMLSEYVFGVIPRGTHDINKCIPPHEAQALLAKYGNVTRLIHGMYYNILNNEWYWTSNLSISYALHAIKT